MDELSHIMERFYDLAKEKNQAVYLFKGNPDYGLLEQDVPENKKEMAYCIIYAEGNHVIK